MTDADGSAARHTFVDLGMTPFANAYLEQELLNEPESFYPLHAKVRDGDMLVQLDFFASPKALFEDYAFFSSFSDTWLDHVRRYTETMVDRFSLDDSHQVVEVGSNDGHLLEHFRERRIPCLGIEPAANVAEAARQVGIPTLTEFFGLGTAQSLVAEGTRADLLIGNNVLAHVPDLDDFIGGARQILKPSGILTMEFPHILNLIRETQFDSIYHEHFSYFSFLSVKQLFAKHGLTLFDVEEIPTHGGSLRIYGRRREAEHIDVTERVPLLERKEAAAGLTHLETYLEFGEKPKAAKRQLLRFLVDLREQGKTIAGYGAPAKGNTLLNYCGVGTDLLDYTVDRSPHKQGRFLPGTHIPIFHPGKLRETKPDYVLILPWNLKDEVMEQMAHVREWGAQFVTPLPEVRVLS
jgi:SAM-dependent methyltransferase